MKVHLIFISLIILLIGCDNKTNEKSQPENASSFSQSKRDSILKDYQDGYYKAETESNKRFPYESLAQEANKGGDGQNKYAEMYRNNVKCYNDIINENTANV